MSRKRSLICNRMNLEINNYELYMYLIHTCTRFIATSFLCFSEMCEIFNSLNLNHALTKEYPL